MSLSTYSDLSTAIEDWLNRNNQTAITNRVPDFIELVQRRLMREVRIPPMEVSTTLSFDADGKAAVPTDYLETKYLVADNGSTSWPVSPAPFNQVKQQQVESSYQRSNVFDVEAGYFYVGAIPSSGETLTLIYYKEIEFISASVSANWFSSYAPELILFGAMAEASLFIKDMEQYAVYENKFKDAKELLQKQKSKGEYAGTPLRVRKARP